jgi:predicted flavoprotein YhiN
MTTKLMVQRYPGLFCAGEMLDWDAPTGGYLLTACMATGRLAGIAASEFCKTNQGANDD